MFPRPRIGGIGGALAGVFRRLRASPFLILFVVFLLLESLIHYYSLLVPAPSQVQDEVFYRGCADPREYKQRERAVIVMLARNGEIDGAMSTVRTFERRFNRFFNYPIMFLNDEPWDADVIAQLNGTVSGEAKFEVIPEDMWGFPPGIDVKAAEKSMKQQGLDGVKYGATASYHHMCRFFSG